ncbi:hypothetical protein [Kribbella capetownensis]|uniref:hypothetical protein n=1 Tax=Kribbella capetownensis TaxID=1572659 RepID=UPI0013F47CF9|nr:hypothetical protein [Kribbella capetownensis]
MKDDESVLAKLQRGDCRSLFDLDDLVAARAVLLHSSQVNEALELSRASFSDVIAEKNTNVGNPSDFKYQQPHLIVRLPADYLLRHPEFAQIRIELQFTTYIQHALQESTHDLIYKGGRFSWREHRLDGQLRGLLEVVDHVLENIASVADAADDPPYGTFDRRNEILVVLRDVLPSYSLPKDLRRLVLTVEELLAAAGVGVEDLPDLLGRHDDLVRALSLTAVDKVFGALFRENPERMLSKARGRVFVITSELETMVPEIKRIPPDRRVNL